MLGQLYADFKKSHLKLVKKGQVTLVKICLPFLILIRLCITFVLTLSFTVVKIPEQSTVP